MAYVGRYAANGSMNVTVVDGSTYTGLNAADGSLNVVVSPGTGYVGAYHPCGAWYVTVSPGNVINSRAPDGSLYVSTTGSNNSGLYVTAVSGSLTPTTDWTADSTLITADTTHRTADGGSV